MIDLALLFALAGLLCRTLDNNSTTSPSMPSPSKKQKKEAEKKEAEKKGAEKKEAEKKEVRRWPGECDDEIPGPFVTIPPQPSRKKPGQLTDEQIHQYFDVGYVKVDNFFQAEELDACREEIKALVEDLAQRLYKAGKIKDLYQDYGFFQRLTMINKDFPGANIILHKLGAMPKAFQKIWAHPNLLNVAEQLLGTSDIMGHPVWNLRTKTPHNEEVTVPWHQDNGYVGVDAYHHHVLTAWIPLLDANENNGCMQMARYGHRKGRVAMHTCCAGGTWYVMLEPEEMCKTLGVDLEKDIVTVPVDYTSVLFFNNMTPHRSLDNQSNDIRWSLDLRWFKYGDSTGFFGVKDGIRMRDSKQEEKYIVPEDDWNKFNSVDRHVDATDAVAEHKATDEFDTTIAGPWMKKWEIVHVNRHVNALEDTTREADQLIFG